jgi:hypothetical protein
MEVKSRIPMKQVSILFLFCQSMLAIVRSHGLLYGYHDP